MTRGTSNNVKDLGGAERASFGFEDIPQGEKAGRVRQVFEGVATRYDLMNDLMSGGIHRLWKARLIDWLDPRPGLELLDVAGGTGDIAFRVLDRLERIERNPDRQPLEDHGRIVVCDLTPEMLLVGRDRAIDQGRLSGLDWVCGNAEALPLPDRSVAAYSIAFGLRNVTDIDQALREAHRVLKPGGRFVCLEFSQVILPVLDKLYDLYSFEFLPRLGAAIAGDREAYQYLVESIRRFPPQEDLLQRTTKAGLGQARYRNLSGGIAALHTAWRL